MVRAAGAVEDAAVEEAVVEEAVGVVSVAAAGAAADVALSNNDPTRSSSGRPSNSLSKEGWSRKRLGLAPRHNICLFNKL